jgi:predicted phosphodiesterase
VVNHPEREASYFHGLPAEGIKGMHDTTAATFMVAGNHDSPSNNSAQDKDMAATARFYNRYYGLHAYQFRYGNGRFMVINDGWVGFDNSSQSAAAASWLAGVGPGNFRVVAAHIKDTRLDKIREATAPDLILAGHTHHSASGNPHPSSGRARQYIASAVREPQYFEFNLFRVDGKAGTFEAVGGPSARVPVIENHSVENNAKPASWTPMLQLSFARDNQGGSTENTATLTNKHDFQISGARVRFVLKKGSYAVTGGVVEQTLENDTVSVHDVTVDLPPRSTTTVSIRPRL